MRGHPLPDGGMLVGPIVVTDEMQVTPWVAAGQGLQECEKLQMGVA